MHQLPHDELVALGERHLWGHFSTVGETHLKSRVMERGDGCYVWDDEGNRYLDGLAGLFTVQVGHGRQELAEAAREQAEKLAYFPIWTYSHPTAIELSARLASHAPGDLNRVFFTTGGAEAVESAWKLAIQYFQSVDKPQKRKVISRYLGYHGTTMGALSITGVPGLRNTFEPLVPGAYKVANTNEYRCSMCALAGSCNLSCANDIEQMILREGPDTVAAVFVEPVQNSGGCFVPAEGYMQRVREICDTYDVLMVSDEVICAFGRLGHMFGSDRFGYIPDIITCAKGLTSGYSPLGAMIVSDRLVEPFIGSTNRFLHGFTFGGHPVSCAVALANLDIFEEEQLLQHVLDNESAFRSALETLQDLPIVGDVRGAGYFYGIEMVRDRETRETFTAEESEVLIRRVLSESLLDEGLICRADDRGDPVIQLSPPLIAGPEQFEEIVSALRTTLLRGMVELGM